MATSHYTFSEDVQCIEARDGQSRCVVVGPRDLAHSAQVPGARVNNDSIDDQIQSALKRTDAALAMVGSDLGRAVKLNFYIAEDRLAANVSAALTKRFNGMHQPAVSVVTSKLAWPDAMIAVDAVAIANQSTDSRPRPQPTSDPKSVAVGEPVRVLSVGPKIYISGQAEKGDGSVKDATKQTMLSLDRTLSFLGLSKKDIVQVKCFVGPISRSPKAAEAIVEFFGNSTVPPCAFVEWISSLPIEIELIVSGNSNPALRAGPAVEIRTPPGMTTPAVYSRLTISRHPSTIYTSGLNPTDSTAAPESQLRSVFSELKRSLDLSGSDWMHLVKATYYVNDEALSKWHNTVRPDYFSPRRPPAASKAMVRNVGRDGHGFMMDIIAVPGEP